jgi:translation initiation factor 2 beta subunit (eIF-2beta)/eIF-5
MVYLSIEKILFIFQSQTARENFIWIFPHWNRSKVSNKYFLVYLIFLNFLLFRASIDGSHALVIRGRYGQRDIESILRKFISKMIWFSSIIFELFFLLIEEYVICKACHSPDTSLGKSDRLTVIKCTSCHSQYSVSSIKTGFQAQVGKRARENK